MQIEEASDCTFTLSAVTGVNPAWFSTLIVQSTFWPGDTSSALEVFKMLMVGTS